MNKQQMEAWVLKNCKFAQNMRANLMAAGGELDPTVQAVGNQVIERLKQGTGEASAWDIKKRIMETLAPMLKQKPYLQNYRNDLIELALKYVSEHYKPAPTTPVAPAAPAAVPNAPKALPRKVFEH